MSDFTKETSQNDLCENRKPNGNEKINIYSEVEINIKSKRDIFKVRCTSRRPTLGGRDKQKDETDIDKNCNKHCICKYQKHSFCSALYERLLAKIEKLRVLS